MSKKFMGILGIVALIGATACTRVEPGHVGIKVNLTGSDRGVDALTLVTGRVFYNPFMTDVIEYPTFVQRIAWTANENEGSRNDESFTFNSIEGSPVNVDVAAAVQFTADKVPVLYTTFRQDAMVLVDGYIRDKIRNSFNRIGSQMMVESIYGSGKSQLLDDVLHAVQEELGPEGIVLTDLSFIGQPRLPENVQNSINQVIEARNNAIRANEKVAQAVAEAEQRAATAKGTADAIRIEAHAQADANKLINSTLTRQLIEFQAMQKWNGTLPTVTGGAVPFIQLPSGGGGQSFNN